MAPTVHGRVVGYCPIWKLCRRQPVTCVTEVAVLVQVIICCQAGNVLTLMLILAQVRCSLIIDVCSVFCCSSRHIFLRRCLNFLISYIVFWSHCSLQLHRALGSLQTGVPVQMFLHHLGVREPAGVDKIAVIQFVLIVLIVRFSSRLYVNEVCLAWLLLVCRLILRGG